MSGIISPDTGYGVLGTLIANAGNVRQNIQTLTEQTSSGLIAQDYAGLGSGAATALDLAPALAHQTTWSSNINAANGTIQVAQNAMTQISAIASNFYAQTSNLNGLNASEIDSIAASARDALTQVAGLLDSKDGNVYVFAGQDSTNPPVPDPDSLGATGFATQIASAVGNLSTAGAPATIAATLASAASNTPGASPFSASLSQPASALAGTSVQIGDGQFVSTGIMASANANVTSTGASTTGSYMRDILRGLATLGAMSSSQASTTGFSDLVSDTRTSFADAITALNGDAGVLGDRQAALQTAQSAMDAVSTALKSQVANVQEVDMAATVSKLTATQTQLQASYQLIATMQSMSLTKYISTA
jgi:flagellar hook-associated protein 3 FlgL